MPKYWLRTIGPDEDIVRELEKFPVEVLQTVLLLLQPQQFDNRESHDRARHQESATR